jgi:hypothetical protein
MEETTQRQQKSIKEKKLLKDSADIVLDIVIDRIQDTKNNRIALPTLAPCQYFQILFNLFCLQVEFQ